MNRVLQRPMFRIGGSAGTGITSGLDQPQKMANGGRTGYAEGTPSFQTTGLPGFLTQFGLNLLSQSPTGNIFQTAATAAQEPFRKFQASQAAAASTAEDRAFQEKLLERQIESDEAIAEMKQKDQFFAAQTEEEQFRELSNIYSDSSQKPIIRDNATDLARFEVKNKDKNYVMLDFNYDNKTREFEPDFRTIPEGGLTYNPKDGFAYRMERREDGVLIPIRLNPFTLEPVQSVDGTE